MMRFLVGVLVPLLALWGWGTVQTDAWATAGGGGAERYLFVIVLAPLIAAWLVFEGVDARAPRRVFDPRVRRPVLRVVLGSAAGTLGAILGATGMLFLPPAVPDAAVLAGAGAIGAGAVLLSLARRRASECVHCSYDLSGSPGAARCPECGRFHSRGAQSVTP